MPKDKAYHECAIRYNEALATYAEGLIETLEVPEVAGWAAGVAKQHRFHMERHQLSLEQLQNGTAKQNKNKRRRQNKKRRQQEETAAIQEKQDGELSAEDVARLDAQIEEMHGSGAVDVIYAAIADGSIFSSSLRVESTPDPELAAKPVDAGVGTASDPDVIEIQPGVTRPMTEQEKAERDAANAQEVTSG